MIKNHGALPLLDVTLARSDEVDRGEFILSPRIASTHRQWIR